MVFLTSSVLTVFFVISDLFGQSSPQEDGLFGGEGTPFGKKGGLFSVGGNLFDDFEGDKVIFIIIIIIAHLSVIIIF